MQCLPDEGRNDEGPGHGSRPSKLRRDVRIDTQADSFLLATKTIFHAPPLTSTWRNFEVKAASIEKLLCLCAGPCVKDSGVCKEALGATCLGKNLMPLMLPPAAPLDGNLRCRTIVNVKKARNLVIARFSGLLGPLPDCVLVVHSLQPNDSLLGLMSTAAVCCVHSSPGLIRYPASANTLEFAGNGDLARVVVRSARFRPNIPPIPEVPIVGRQ